jgi:hypothetical protein
MNKTLCVVVLLLGTALALSFGSASTTGTTSTSPLIVAKRRLVNQTAPIPTTTIFTPAQDGVFRLSVYATLTGTDSSSQSYWQWGSAWTDDAGPQNPQQVYFSPNQDSITSGQFLGLDAIGGGLLTTIEAKAGTPITFTVSQVGGPDNSAYSLYYVLEQIE